MGRFGALGRLNEFCFTVRSLRPVGLGFAPRDDRIEPGKGRFEPGDPDLGASELVAHRKGSPILCWGIGCGDRFVKV